MIQQDVIIALNIWFLVDDRVIEYLKLKNMYHQQGIRLDTLLMPLILSFFLI